MLSKLNTMKKKLIFHLLYWLFLNQIIAQQTPLDSMMTMVETTTNDSIKALTQLKIGFQYVFKDTKQARKYIEDGYALSVKINNKYGIVNALSIKGVFYDVTGNSDSARIQFEQALELSKTYHFPDMEIKLLNNLGMYHWNQGLKTEALAFFNQCLELNQTLPENKKMDESIIQNNIGLIYQEMGFYEKALHYHKRALTIRQANPNLKGAVAHSYNNIGICYRNLKKYPESEKAYQDAMAVSEKYDNQTQYFESMSNLANLYAELNRHNESLKLNLVILTESKSTQLRNKFLMNVYAMIAGNYIHLKLPYQAVKYAHKALGILDKEPDLYFFASPVYKNASLGYYLSGDTQKGQYYQQLYEKQIEQRFIDDHAGKLAEMETKFNTALKEKEILELKQQHEKTEWQLARMELAQNKKNMLLYSVTLFALFVIVGCITWYRWKQFNTRLKSEQTLQNAVFKSEQNERIRIARDLHDSIGQKLALQKMMISKLISESAENERNELINASGLIDDTITEVRTISHNLIPAELNLGLLKAIEDTAERIRFAGNVEVELNSNAIQLKEEELPIEQQITVYRIVQEILNNLIKHARATRISIDMNLIKNQLFVSIKDNGVGFDTSNLVADEGLGWKNLNTRVKFLSGELNIQSHNSEGTTVKIIIPVNI